MYYTSFRVDYMIMSNEKKEPYSIGLCFPYAEYGERAIKMEGMNPFVLLKENEDFQEKLLQHFKSRGFRNIEHKNLEKSIFSFKKEDPSHSKFQLVIQNIVEQEKKKNPLNLPNNWFEKFFEKTKENLMEIYEKR